MKNLLLGPPTVKLMTVVNDCMYNSILNFLLMPMGDLAHWSANVRPSAQPLINMRGNFSVHMSAELP